MSKIGSPCRMGAAGPTAEVRRSSSHHGVVVFVAVAMMGATPAARAQSPSTVVAPAARPQGSHFGVGLGGVYLPTSSGTWALAGLVSANLPLGLSDARVSGMFVHIESSRHITNAGYLSPRFNLGLTDLFALGIGSMIGYGTIADRYSTRQAFMVGMIASPAVFRFGERRQFEVSVNAFVVRDFSADTFTPGGYFVVEYYPL